MDWCPPKADPTGVGSCSAHQHAHSQEEQSAKLGESPALPSKWPQYQCSRVSQHGLYALLL